MTAPPSPWAAISMALATLPLLAWQDPQPSQQSQQPAAPAAHRPVDDASCRVCHPGPTAALQDTPHAFLLGRSERSCSSCHGDQSAHAWAAARGEPPLAPTPIDPQACARCHGSTPPPVASAAHPFVGQEPPAALPTPRAEPFTPPLSHGATALPPRPDAGLSALGLQWSAMAALGYRFVDVDGSQGRYDTDYNLDDGFRLLEGELEGRGNTPWLDTVQVRANDIGDPYERVQARMEKRGLYEAEAEYRKRNLHYRAEGDFHRVDREEKVASVHLQVEPADDVQTYVSWTRLDQDGFWLTNRVGNLNVTPQSTVPGVQSPRRLESDHFELGATSSVADVVNVTGAVEYLDQSQNDRWTFSRPAPVNAAFPESEDLASHGSLHGPGAKLLLSHADERWSFDVSGRVLDLDRRVSANGFEENFDIAESTTTTDADADGHARTWLLDASTTVLLTDAITLVGDLRYVDHREEMHLDETEVTVYPTLSVTTTSVTNADPRTTQRKLDGSIGFDVSPVDELVLTLGYGFSREELHLPDLEAGDDDVTSGTIRDDGVFAGVQWRPNEHWTVQAHHREFGQGGIKLYEIVEDRVRGTDAKVRYTTGPLTVEAFGDYRLATYDAADHRNRTVSAGLTASVALDADLELHGSYVFSDIDSRTLTNFYFDPDPDPVPTFVGFEGTTHTVAAGLAMHPSPRLHCNLDALWTDTHGDFDVQLFDGHAGVAVDVLPGGQVGVDVRYVDYGEQAHLDDYDALLTMVYWRQRLGRRD